MNMVLSVVLLCPHIYSHGHMVHVTIFYCVHIFYMYAAILYFLFCSDLLRFEIFLAGCILCFYIVPIGSRLMNFEIHVKDSIFLSK